jgi:hypothetical protein
VWKSGNCSTDKDTTVCRIYASYTGTEILLLFTHTHTHTLSLSLSLSIPTYNTYSRHNSICTHTRAYAHTYCTHTHTHTYTYTYTHRTYIYIHTHITHASHTNYTHSTDRWFRRWCLLNGSQRVGRQTARARCRVARVHGSGRVGGLMGSRGLRGWAMM